VPWRASRSGDASQSLVTSGLIDSLRAVARGEPSAAAGSALAGSPREQCYAVLDLETTGLDARRDEIVELAIVCISGTGVVQDEFSSLVSVSGPVGASWVHGIQAEQLRGAPSLSAVAAEVGERLDGRVLAGHNVSFDLKFLAAGLGGAGRGLAGLPRLCTIDLAQALGLPEGALRLTRACAAHGIPIERANRALGDARATARLLARYLEIAEQQGYLTVVALLDAATTEYRRARAA
jgi:DNA polymerase-3 subunit epsilon